MHDTFSWILAWLVIFVVPIAFIILIWKVHEIPEKLAKKRNHYNVEAVKFLSWVGLFTGGLLFPLAFVYAVMKPVSVQVTAIPEEKRFASPPPPDLTIELLNEIKKLQTRISDLELHDVQTHKIKEEIPPQNPNNNPSKNT